MKTSPLILAAFLIMSSINLFGFELETIYGPLEEQKVVSSTNPVFNHNNDVYDLTIINNPELDYIDEELIYMAELLTDEVYESTIEQWMLESDLMNDEFSNLEPWMIYSDLIIENNSEIEVEEWMLDDDLLETESEDDNLEIVEAWMLDFEIDNK